MRHFFSSAPIVALMSVVLIYSAGGCSKPASQAPAQVSSATPQVADSVPEAIAVEPAQDISEPSPTSPAAQLIVADFDTGDKPNNLGGDFGAWNKDPDDTTQICTVAFETEDALADPSGYALKLDYDVDSPNPAYNGFWMKLNGLDASGYNTLSFYIRGDGRSGYTKRLKVELKDGSMVPSPHMMNNITDVWKKVEVPFENFKKVSNWSALAEFVVVFEDMNSDPKQGAILIDQIAFEKKQTT